MTVKCIEYFTLFFILYFMLFKKFYDTIFFIDHWQWEVADISKEILALSKLTTSSGEWL